MPSILEVLKNNVTEHKSRLAQDERHNKERADATSEDRLTKLRLLLENYMVNTTGRVAYLTSDKVNTAKALDGLTIEKTYADWEIKSKEKRTTALIKLFLDLCDGDEVFFINEWNRAAADRIKIGFKSYVWACELIRDLEKGTITVLFVRKRAPRARATVTP